MAVPTYLNEGGADKVLCLTDQAEAAKYLAAIETSSAPSAYYGWMGVATHVEDDPVATPGGFTTAKAPVVLVAGDDGANVNPLQMSGDLLKVQLGAGTAEIGKLAAGTAEIGKLAAGTAAIGKLAANSGVDIGDVDVLSLPSLAAGTNAIGKLAANSGVDIGDVDVLSLPSLPAGTNNIGDVDVLTLPALAAGSNAIGKLAANSGVDIGDVDVTSVPAPLNVVGGGTEAAALRVTLANNSTGLVSVDDGGGALSIDDGGNVITVDGEIKDDGPSWTPVRKYLSKSTTADATLWDPTAARLYIPDLLVSISGTAVDVTLAFGAGTAMTDTIWVFRGDVRGGATHTFRTPVKSGTDAHNLNVALSAAQQVDILVLGYEAAT